MTMTIGRASINEDPYGGTIRMAGNMLQFESSIIGADVNEMKARMFQLEGLVDNGDEPVVPFTWTEDTTLNGYYRVRAVQLAPVSVYLATGECPFSITLERIESFNRPALETVMSSILMQNPAAVTTPTGLYTTTFIPGSGYYEFDGTPAGTLTTEDGSLGYGTAALASAYSGLSYVSPADYYKATARIEVKFGSTWYPWIGDQMPAGIGLNWRISNAYVRLYPTANGSDFYFKVETYRAGNWVGQEFTNSVYSAGVFSSYRSTTGLTGVGAGDPVILMNTPKRVIVQAYTHSAASFATRVPNLFSIRMGDTWAEMRSVHDTNVGLIRSSNEAGTAFSGGVRATANDANGLRYLISVGGCSVATADTTKGGVRPSTGPTVGGVTFQIAPDYQAGVFTTDTAVRDLFYAVRTERLRVVAR